MRTQKTLSNIFDDIKLQLEAITAHAQDQERRLTVLERVGTPNGQSITYTRTIDGGKLRVYEERKANWGRRKNQLGRRIGDQRVVRYGG